MLKKLVIAIVIVGILSVASVTAAQGYGYRPNSRARYYNHRRQGYAYRRHAWRPGAWIVVPLPGIPGGYGGYGFPHGNGYFHFNF